MSYYQKIEKGLERWVDALEKIEKILEEQEKATSTIHYKTKTCCEKVKEIIKDIKVTKQEKEIVVER